MSTSAGPARSRRSPTPASTVAYCIVTDGDAGGAETGIPAVEMAALRHDEQRKAAADRRRARRALPRLPGRPARGDARPAPRHLPRDPQVRPHRVLDAVARAHTGPDLREPSRPPRGRRGDDRARCIPTPATAGPTPSSTTRVSNRGPSTRSGSASARDGPTHYIDITDTVDRKIEALMSHKSQLPDPDATETMVRGWTAAIARAGRPARRTIRRSSASGEHEMSGARHDHDCGASARHAHAVTRSSARSRC